MEVLNIEVAKSSNLNLFEAYVFSFFDNHRDSKYNLEAICSSLFFCNDFKYLQETIDVLIAKKLIFKHLERFNYYSFNGKF
jgi:hypothetical protein